MHYFKQRGIVFVSVPVFLLFFLLALDSMMGDSPTMDEQNHMARGAAFLATADPRLSLEHPPLINSISGLFMLIGSDVVVPTDHPSWDQPFGWYAFADQFMWHYGNDVDQLIFLARLPIVFLTMMLGLVVFHFGRGLWGSGAAIATMFLLLLDPNIMAHGRLATTDLGGTLTITLSLYLLWRMWQEDKFSWQRLAAAGVALGTAVGSKYSSVVFVPVFVLLAVLPLYRERWSYRAAGRRLLMLLGAGVLGLVVLWFIYGFEWGRPTNTGVLGGALHNVMVPMPTFWDGLFQISDISGGGRPAFLLGEVSTEGWWYYFFVALLVKTPELILALFVLMMALLLWRPTTRKQTLFLLLPLAVFLGVSTQSSLNIGYRHLLPIVPLIYLVAGGLFSRAIQPLKVGKKGWSIGPSLMGLVLAVQLGIVLLIHPHYLSYFNLASGGPEMGHRILVDSNIDWGQDLLRLRSWMRDNNVGALKLSWFGTADPDYYGIANEPLPGLPYHYDLWWDVPFDTKDPDPGIYAISVTNLWELPLAEKRVFHYFRERDPDDRIGYSIYVYRVAADEGTP